MKPLRAIPIRTVRFFACILFTMLSHLCYAQFYDRTWLVGSVQMVKLTFNSDEPDTASFHTNDANSFF